MRKEEGPQVILKANSEPNSTTTSHHHRAEGCSNPNAQLAHRRWRRAVQRALPLDCGCRIACHCTFPPLTDNQIDGYADAARYILDTTGCTPMLPLEVLRGLYRRGGEDRALAEKLHAANAGSPA
jgi:hypothetical protein